MAPSPQQDNQAWRFVNLPLPAGIILCFFSLIFAGLLRISNQLNDLGNGQRLGLIEIGALKQRVDRLEANNQRQESDIVLLKYQVNQR